MDAQQISTHRVLQLSELAYGCTCEAMTNTRAAATAIEIGNLAAARIFMRRSTRLNAIAVKCNQRLGDGA